MILKSIELNGFKSFPKKTSISFEEGVTVIIGPNGSGKSNISDAVRWVFGEMSTKILRGNKMEDVIFSGTKDFKPASFARVSLVIDNSDRKAETDTSEIKITRQLTRSGDSGYYINDRAVRQKDIYELFLNTGIGKEGYSIIGQGKIAEFISKKSEERRSIFEEASGISKFRYKKAESERKLTEVNENLIRVKDILSEIEVRVEPLRIESEKAKKYLELYEQKKKSEVYSFVGIINKYLTELEKIVREYELAKLNYELVCSDIEKIDRKSEELYQTAQKLNFEFERLKNEKFNINSALVELKSRIEINSRDIDRIKTEEMLNLKIKSENDTKLVEIKKNSEEKNSEITAISNKYKTMELQVEDRFSHSEQLALEINSHLEAEQQISDELFETEKSINQIKIKLAEIENNIKNRSERLAELDAQEKRIAAESAKNENEFLSLQSEKENYQAKSDKIRAELAATEKKLSKVAEECDINKKAADGIYLETEKNIGYIENLKVLAENLEGFSEGTKKVMREAKSGRLTGIIGTIAEVITTDRRYITALETALGQNIQNIIVEDEDAAIGAIKYLKNNNLGRATFYPKTTVRGTRISNHELQTSSLPGMVGIACDLVTYDNEFTDIVNYLLGRTIICDNIENASESAMILSYKYKFVTLDGQVINSGGSFSGGSSAKKISVLSNKAEIEILNDRSEKGKKQYADLCEVIKNLMVEADNITAQKKEFENSFTDTGNKLIKINSELDLKIILRKNYDDTIKGICAEIKKISENHDESSYNNLVNTLGKREEVQKKLAAELASRKKILKEMQAEKEVLNMRINKEKLLLAEIQNQKNLESERLENLYKEIIVLTNRNNTINTENLDRIKMIDKLTTENARFKTEIFESDDKLKAFDQNIERIELKRYDIEKNINEIRRLQKDKNDAKEISFREMTRFESQKQSKEKEHDQIISKLWDEYELTASEAENYIKNTNFTDEETSPKYLNSIKEKIKALGSVNVGAIEEYRELYARYTFMTEQSDDLVKSVEKLNGIIDNLGEQMKLLFVDSIKTINKNFKEVFCELFGGGYAQVIVTEPENILESELEIEVQPPGKNVKHISLLSGGEQAFVAIALYFALLKLNPAPFCILDEIEAALDEINVDRFAAYIKKYSNHTQFIIISHRRGTMESADRLYGITMEEKGVSRYLVLDMREAEKKLGVIN